MAEEKTIARAAGVVLVMNLISRLLGFARDAAIAGQYGASAAADAYWVAYTIPFFLQAIFGVAFVSVMVPIFTPYILEEKREEGWKIASGIFNLTAVTLLAITLLGYWGAPVLVKLTAPGFGRELAGLTVHLTRIMFPSIVFMGLGMLVTGILNAFKIFALPAFAPGAANILIITAVIVFGHLYGIDALAWGTLVGFGFFLLVQLPALRGLNFRYQWLFNLHHPAVRRFAGSVWVVVLGMSVNQIYLALNRVFASNLQSGSISALNYAYRIMTLPLGIFVAAVATAIFPSLSRYAAAGRKSELAKTLVRGIRMVLLITVPAAVGMAVLKVPVVKLLFERGAFAARDTMLTADSLLFFAAGLPAFGINLVITRAYYALDDARSPVITGMLSVVVNIVFSFVLLYPLQAAGLALADTLAALTNASLMVYILARREPEFAVVSLFRTLVKILAAAAGTGLAAWGAYLLGLRYLPAGNTLVYLANVVLAVAAGAGVYVAAVFLFRLEEAAEIRNLFFSRLSSGNKCKEKQG
ncbi:MAG: murein biosynthesis integral membrane protein MurJ [Thermoanaerobacteraceae bacterium]|nr:murein biosynthesis integral membrane protein MurJ [Thermoanaerobacteraceae bacterium]